MALFSCVKNVLTDVFGDTVKPDGAAPSPNSGDDVLLETGDRLLLETGDALLLE